MIKPLNKIPSSSSVVSWTALISSHSNTPLSLHHFISMLRHHVLPNHRTLASLLKTCAVLPFSLSFALSLHCLSLKLSLNTDPFTGSALISFYTKFRLPDHARRLFDEIPQPDEVCYSALIVGLAQNSQCISAISAFADMKSRNVGSTMYSVSGALRAVGELAALEQCSIIHGHTVTSGLYANVIVGSALIDVYGKAGLVLDARRVFDDNFDVMNIVGRNSLMSGYAQHGDDKSTLELFNSMEAQGFTPDKYTFLAVLTALCNSGLCVEAQMWLTRMRENYRLEPELEHYTCLVVAMGRAGRLEEAGRIAMTMPFVPDAAVWRSLLSACGSHGEADMAKVMARRLMELNPNDDSAYVIVANVLSAKGRWEEVAEVRKLMKDRRVRKEGGRSWIEVKGKVHIFMVGDKRSEKTMEIYAKLAELMEEIEKLGYVPVWEEVLHEVGRREKRESLWYHSEKLALAFGLVSGAAPPGKALRIVKNLRICRDCHEAFKYISIVAEREIIVRDFNRYHGFLNGKCSCGDIW